MKTPAKDKYIFDKALLVMLSIGLLSLIPIENCQARAKICPHINLFNGQNQQWMQGAPWIKVLDRGMIAGARATGAKVFYRPVEAIDEGSCTNGTAWGQAVLNLLNGISRSYWPDAIGYRNEFHDDDVTPQNFIAYYDTLRAGGYTGMIVYGAYGCGWPREGALGLPVVQAAVNKSDGIEVHEYFDLTCAWNDQNLAHRHVRMMREFPYTANKPWFIGEMGSDIFGEDPQRRRGWRDNNKLSEDAFIRELNYYINGGSGIVPISDKVVACFIFQTGASNWSDFEIVGTRVADWIKASWGSASNPTATPVQTVPCPRGDADCNGTITPGDAMIAFQIYLELINPTGNEPCNVRCAADWNYDGSVSPGDALCIFNTYMEKPC